MKFYKSTLPLLFTISLLQGCSGHALQDLVDGDRTDELSPKNAASDVEKKIVPPSQNSALQSISPSTMSSDDHLEYRYMQKDTNEWIENEWNPLTETNTTDEKNGNNSTDNRGLNEDDNSSFTLQHFVDKTKIYLANRDKRDANKTKAPSHVDKVNEMPAIGKTKGR